MLIEYEDMFPIQATVATAVVSDTDASSADADADAAGGSRRLRDLAEDQVDTTSYNCVSEIKKRN